jgi:hypothetical protein
VLALDLALGATALEMGLHRTRQHLFSACGARDFPELAAFLMR